jgi:methyltransferase family protein/C-methyltransferase-like protein
MSLTEEKLIDVIRDSKCPACGYHLSVPFYEPGSQPLATIAWPSSKDDAITMNKYPLNFVRCVSCGHVYNEKFSYSEVPYSEKPNLMFNNGQNWSVVLNNIIIKLSEYLQPGDTVIEIGYGDGSFLNNFSNDCPEILFVGFDPHGKAIEESNNLSFKQEYFIPIKDVPKYKPKLIISRHVLEHLDNPLGMIESISFASSWSNINILMYLEVPCIDNALGNQRTVDFYYEHNSHFTTNSFTNMLKRASVDIEYIGHDYGGEIIYAIAHAMKNSNYVTHTKESINFYNETLVSNVSIKEKIKIISEKKIAIWGGTGKAAAFINTYELDSTRFPIVVDSDRDKVGTFVPGMGQEILFRDYLKEWPVEIIIIPMHWRAQDVVKEIELHKISYEKILIEHQGELVDYFLCNHPYSST